MLGVHPVVIFFAVAENFFQSILQALTLQFSADNNFFWFNQFDFFLNEQLIPLGIDCQLGLVTAGEPTPLIDIQLGTGAQFRIHFKVF